MRTIHSSIRRERPTVEWPTLSLIILCLVTWALGTTVFASFSAALGIAITALSIALYSSLQHEIIHGHPFRSRRINEALVSPALSLVIPFLRFRDTHLAHHQDVELTDPYDDPESNYLAERDWLTLPKPVRTALAINNTLFGRLLIGPIVSQVFFVKNDIRLANAGDRRVMKGWLYHLGGLVPVVAWLATFSEMSFVAYLLAAYISLSIVKIRTFLEHQAHETARGRTVIIEDRGLLAFLFLNNNLHAVHHMHPNVPWYLLKDLYRRRRDRFVECNDGYVFKSYGSIFAAYLFQRKDDVVHPLWHRNS